MDPNQIELIAGDVDSILGRPDVVARAFYSCLFELDPTVRPMFPDDLEAQRKKLIDELGALVELGTSLSAETSTTFTARARELGARHRGYGTEVGHYDTAGIALLQALETTLDGWDDLHRQAWTSLYHLVAQTMLEGA